MIFFGLPSLVTTLPLLLINLPCLFNCCFLWSNAAFVRSDILTNSSALIAVLILIKSGVSCGLSAAIKSMPLLIRNSITNGERDNLDASFTISVAFSLLHISIAFSNCGLGFKSISKLTFPTIFSL